jgi:hypothetical protein
VRRRAAIAAACAGTVVLLGPATSPGQFLHEDQDDAGRVISLFYQGDSDWLVTQQDPRSRWHRLPHLEDVTFNNFAVSREALRHVLSLKQVKGFNLGIGPEGVEVAPEDLALLGQADHLLHLGLCYADPEDDHLRFLPDMDGLESLTVASHGEPRHSPRFTDAVASLLVAAPKLRWIGIHSDGLTDEFVRRLAARGDLESLEIASPLLTDASLALLGALPALRRLRIRSPRITDEGVKHLRALVTLEELQIDSPRIGSGALPHLSGLERLSHLDLSLDSVRPEDLASVQHLTALRILALRKAPIGDETFPALRGHPGLESLFLERSRPTLASLPVIESLPKLTNVAFRTETEATRLLLGHLRTRGIKDLSLYPKTR